MRPRGDTRLRILGIDPGSRRTGWGIVEDAGGRLVLVGAGCLQPPTAKSLADRLGSLLSEVGDIVRQASPDVAGVESTFHGVNTRSLVVLSQARGAILAALGAAEVEVFEYSPAEIKSSVAGSGRADKDAVARMVGMQLGLRNPPTPRDATDALAVAICVARRYRAERISRALKLA